MNIKPFRDISEHEVINLFAYDGAVAPKGTFVELKSLDLSGATNGFTNIPVGNNYNGTFSYRYANQARVANAASGSAKVLGMLLYDVNDNDENGQAIRFLSRDAKVARGLVSSGETVPILTRGLVEIGGFVGSPGPGSGAYVSNSGDGSISVGAPGAAGIKVGKFLSTSGADGYAILKVEL